MKKYLTILSLPLLLFAACKKQFSAPLPNTKWDAFDSAKAVVLKTNINARIEGVYAITNGNGTFGDTAVLKWSYTINNRDTSFYLSILCEKEVGYFICEAKRLDTNILFNGYWRKMVNTETGAVRLTISRKGGAEKLLNNIAFASSDTIVIKGIYGNGSLIPDQEFSLKYIRPLYRAKPLENVAHRGGGRTSDLLPASENSVEIIKLASQFGATGVEIDVRFTSDGVPILFHDKSLNERVIQKSGLFGDIDNYSYAQLNTLVRLIKGERIPTLREALNTVVYNTPINFVWLDTKYNGKMDKVHELQKEFTAKAVTIGRKVEIAIGLPDDEAINNFLALKDYKTTPSICELSLEDVEKTNAAIWAPRWTLGKQNEEVDKVHAAGKRAMVWTLDVPASINDFMTQGKFDGILTNYPSVTAYYHYVRQ
jgi:glycerophosphoryl diester phosphodiesterase